MKRTVLSREYKAMLKRDSFDGSQDKLFKGARKFWKSFRDSIADIVLDTGGKLDEITKRRTLSFYDTVHSQLESSDYIFRERIDSVTGGREVTLKFRHPDRYISEDRDMTAGEAKLGVTKLEEDIKLPFTTLYSFSTTQKIAGRTSLKNLNDVATLYPGLKKRLRPFQSNAAISKVGNFVADEIVIGGATFRIGEKPKVKADCALIVWYDAAGGRARPALVEFSFRYGNRQGEYQRETSQRAYDVFRALPKALAEWLTPKGSTKTAYVFSRA